MTRFTKIIVGTGVLALMLTGCGGNATVDGNDLNTITAGTLTVCSDTPYPPFEFDDPDSPIGFSGFDIDVIAAIAERLNLKTVVVVTDFNALQSGVALAAGSCDVGASAMTITEERRANIDFSDPYYDSLQSLLVSASSSVKDLSEMSGMRIGLQTGTTGEIYAQKNAPKEASLVSFPTDAEMWLALQSKQVDALLQDYPVNYQHVQDDPDYAIVGKYDTKEQYGFAAAKDQKKDLLKAINAQLKEIRKDGTYDTIYAKYFGSI